MGFVDLHSHVLPAIDDGAVDLDESRALLQGLADLGFEDVCATPHQKVGQFMPTADEILQARAQVLDDAPVRLCVAAENFWDSVFFERLPTLSFPRYPVEDRAFLFEVSPAVMPPQIEDHLFRLRVRGLLPVLAHPERYAAIQRDPERCLALGKVAALCVDLGALGGWHGKAARDTARKLVERGFAHAVASDVHHRDDLREVADGVAWLEKRVGKARVQQLLSDGPRQILLGEIPDTD